MLDRQPGLRGVSAINDRARGRVVLLSPAASRASGGSATTGTGRGVRSGLGRPLPGRPGSAEQAVDVVGADPHLLVVVLAELDVVEHVEVALRLAVLVQPDQRPGDVE